MEDVLMLQLSPPGDAADEMVVVGAGRVFQCKTCDRQFPTFQALGGHRTGHRRPKPRGDVGQHSHQAKAPKVHGCTICGEEFAMGQALGGHMRRHRAEDASQRRRCAEASRVCFDLNLPPTEQEEEDDVGFLTLGLGNGLAGKVPVLGYVDRSAITF